MDLFPQQPSFHNPSSDQEFPNHGTNKNMRLEGERAHMTMIYEGKVYVFSDLAAEKAEQILRLAEHDGTSPQIYSQLNHRLAPNNPNQWNRSVSVPSFLENINQGCNFDASMDHMARELPIARRNSLHRFLAKRLHTCGGRGPYHNSGNHLAAVSQPRLESKWWTRADLELFLRGSENIYL